MSFLIPVPSENPLWANESPFVTETSQIVATTLLWGTFPSNSGFFGCKVNAPEGTRVGVYFWATTNMKLGTRPDRSQLKLMGYAENTVDPGHSSMKVWATDPAYQWTLASAGSPFGASLVVVEGVENPTGPTPPTSPIAYDSGTVQSLKLKPKLANVP